MAVLQITRREEPEKPVRVPLAGTRCVIGRNPQADVVLDDESVSPDHAELHRGPFEHWWIHDLHSSNGTFVNGHPVTSRIVASADEIVIGRFSLRLQLQSPALTDTIPPPPPIDWSSPLVSAAELTELVPTVDARPPVVSAARLKAISALTPMLMSLSDARERLRAFCRALVDDAVGASSAMVVRLRGEDVTDLISGPFLGPGDGSGARPILSRGVVRKLWYSRRAVVAARAPDGLGAGRSRPFAVVACPLLEHRRDKLDALYVELAEARDADDWHALVELAAAIYLQVERLWETKEQAEVSAAVERELEMARQIQSRLVPRSKRFAGHLDVAVGFQPCLWVGGDYVDAVELADGRVLLALADVCGKGMQAALVASSLHTLVHSSGGRGCGLKELGERMNRYLGSYLPPHSFVTLVALAIDPTTGAFEHVNAGHPPAFVIRRDGDVSVLPSGCNTALGIARERLHVQRGVLMPGDTLFLHSDGLTEGALLPAARVRRRLLRVLRDELTAAPGQRADVLKGRVSAALFELRGARITSDDTTFLIARRSGAAEHAG